MITKQQIPDVIGANVYGADQQKIGTVGHVFLDSQTDAPAFATVKTGMFGRRESFVPLERSELSQGELRIPFDSQQVKDAPNVEAEQGILAPQEEEQLYRHYGIAYAPVASQGETGEPATRPAGDEAMTRSEEQMRVGKESVEAGRARLRKYVVTEEVQQTVPVTREEVRVEREPVTDETPATTAGRGIGEEEQEVTLYEERPVVSKEEVPVERVRLTKDAATEQEQVSEQVRKEQVEEEIPERQRGERR